MTRTVSLNDHVLSSLSEDRAELLALLRARQLKERDGIKLCPRQPGQIAELPASWPQQRLWFIDQLEGTSVAYHITEALRLRGALDEDVLERALNRLVERHESLRTTFVALDGEPRQRIVPCGRFPLQVFDLSTNDVATRTAALQAHKLEEASRPFDLAVGPLIRGRLLRLSQSEYVLLITMHHIVSDGWSMGVFIRELVALYSAFRERKDDPLVPLPIQYADYAQWQQEYFQGQRLESQLEFWRAQLDGAAPELDLPTDRPRPAIRSHSGDSVPIQIASDLTASIKALAERQGMSVFMILYAAWALLLSRLSGQEDVSVGTPVANRRRPEVEGLIGFFVNTLVLRTAVPGDQPLGEYLQKVKEVTLSAYDHQDVPFEKVVEAAQPQRSLSRNPLFQTMLVLLNAPPVELRLPGLMVLAEQDGYRSSMFDLLLVLQEREGAISGMLNFAIDLFDRHTIERWGECFTVLLRSMIDRPASSIGDLPILSDAEAHRVIREFNATAAHYPAGTRVHELFEAQARRTPQVVAVSHGEWRLTYEELNERANRLARYLQGRGVRAGDLVGICMERNVDMVTGIVAVLKTGAAYVPLDSDYPAQRLQAMLDDASPRVMLIQESLRARLPATAVETIALDVQAAHLGEVSEEDLLAKDIRPATDDLVYVIFTSGSTGRPKGTTMPHRAMVNLIEWHRSQFERLEGRRVLQFAALSFDVAFQEIFTTLATGGTLVLLDEWVRRDARALAQFLKRNAIERLFVPPLMLQSLAESIRNTGDVPTMLEDVITAGEQLRITPEVLDLFNALPACRLHNHYGPTETHVVTAFTLSGDRSQWPAVPSIGKPVANVQIYLLDTRGNPVPVGVAGEIWIGGASVACGYLGRPELTAQRFMADPFSQDPYARLYRTGDLGRWRPDGSIEYLGRNDDQVKVRGYRIELGEVEQMLVRHPAVKDAVVIARADEVSSKRLVAYVVPDDMTTPPLADELRAHLRGILPEYMLPAAFVVLESFPRTLSGKLNRRALPEPDQSAFATRDYEAPCGETEEKIAAIWRELLRVERVGRQDDFFELGGHSLLATRAISRVRDVLNIELPVRAVFEAPTLEQFAARAATDKHTQATRLSERAETLRHEIDAMDDQTALARIAALERELAPSSDDTSAAAAP